MVFLNNYKLKKNEFFEEKLKISEELEQIKQNGSSWLEPFRQWIGSALSCAKIARAKNTCHDLAIMAKTVGSNFSLLNRRLAVELEFPFAVLQTPPPVWSQPFAKADKTSWVTRLGFGPRTNTLKGYCSTVELAGLVGTRLFLSVRLSSDLQIKSVPPLKIASQFW